MGLLNKIVGTHSEREVKRVIPIVDKIESLEPEMEKLSDEELKGKTDEFKKIFSTFFNTYDRIVESQHKK